MTFDLYVWKAPRDLDADRAEALVESRHCRGHASATSPAEIVGGSADQRHDRQRDRAS